MVTAVLPHLELTCYVLGDTWFKSLTSSKTIKYISYQICINQSLNLYGRSWIGGFILALAQSNHDLRRAACDYANKCMSESLGSAVYDLILTELFDFVKQVLLFLQHNDAKVMTLCRMLQAKTMCRVRY